MTFFSKKILIDADFVVQVIIGTINNIIYFIQNG